VLVHVVDLSQPDPVGAVETVERELAEHSPSLPGRPAIVAGNKLDLPEARARWDGFAAAMAARGRTAMPISAATGDGVLELLRAVVALLRRGPAPAAEEGVGVSENSASGPHAAG
jgi:GTP-binding protein